MMETQSYQLWMQLHSQKPLLLDTLAQHTPSDSWPSEFTQLHRARTVFHFHATQSWEQILEDIHPIIATSNPLLEALFSTDDFLIHLMQSHPEPLTVQTDAFLLSDQSVFALLNLPKTHLVSLIHSFLAPLDQSHLFTASIAQQLYTLTSESAFWQRHFGASSLQSSWWTNKPVYFEKSQTFFTCMHELLQSYQHQGIWQRLHCSEPFAHIEQQLRAFSRYQDFSLKALQQRVQQLRTSVPTAHNSAIFNNRSVQHIDATVVPILPELNVPVADTANSQRQCAVAQTPLSSFEDIYCVPSEFPKFEPIPQEPTATQPEEPSGFEPHFLDFSEWEPLIPQAVEVSHPVQVTDVLEHCAVELESPQPAMPTTDGDPKASEPVATTPNPPTIKPVFTAKAPSTVIVPPDAPNRFLPRSQAALERPPMRGRLGQVGIHAQPSFQKKYPTP